MRLLRPVLLAALVLITAAACARGVSMNQDAGQTYAVSVRNDMPHPMIVSFDDGSGTRLLGTVAADRTERFVIAASAQQTITIIATDEGDTHTVRRTVTLEPGGTVDVRIN
ncbi:MAG: hypothetical protein P8177_08280 [Gemmatimonadota bacterium]|jgi:hypothetical protein